MQFNIEIERNRQYCEDICKNENRWALVFLRIYLCFLVVLMGIDVLLQFKIHYMALETNISNLFFLLLFIFFERNFIKITANLVYFVLRKRNRCGKVVLRFSDDSFQMYYPMLDETKSYSVRDIRVRKVKDFYKMIIKWHILYINANNLSEQEEAALQAWMEMVNNIKCKKNVGFVVGSILIVIIAGGIFLYANSKKSSSNTNLIRFSVEKATEDFGADMPRLGYVDEKKLIVYDDTGIYVFESIFGLLVDYVSFEEQNLGGLQGDNATEVKFSKDGQYIYLHSLNNEVSLIYDTAARKFENPDFNFEYSEFWNANIAQADSIENDLYYSVGDIIQHNGKLCFLAIQKNMNPDYGALIYVVADEQSENIYGLFNHSLSQERTEKIADDEKADTEQNSDTVQEKMMQKYEAILADVIEGKSPDGDGIYMEPPMGTEYYENKYAIYDVDGDGRQELIISYLTASMAGMWECIFDYNPETDEVSREFLEFPALTYYDNGIIKAEWSHNQGRGPDFWPFTLYSYDSDTDSYIEIGAVDTWDKKYFSQTNDGTPFPDDADIDGDGIVYTIRDGGVGDESFYKIWQDGAEYEKWYQSIVGEGSELSIPWKVLENNSDSTTKKDVAKPSTTEDYEREKAKN